MMIDSRYSRNLSTTTFNLPSNCQVCTMKAQRRFADVRYLVELKGRFDRVICDPPFLSTDCQTKGIWPMLRQVKTLLKVDLAAMSVRWLLKPTPKDDSAVIKPKIIVCTGERMESMILKLYPGTRTTTFVPQHTRGRLSNEFQCYANYECHEWSWR